MPLSLQLRTCCGCCSLQTGTVIIGVLGILLAAGGLVANINGLENIDNTSSRQQIKVAIGYLCISAIIDVLLLYGAVKESRYFLLPWLIYIAIGVGIISVFSVIAMFFDATFVILLLICAGYWYAWLCVLSYYRNIHPMNTPAPVEAYQTPPIPTMLPTVVTYIPQPPPYEEIGKGPQVV